MRTRSLAAFLLTLAAALAWPPAARAGWLPAAPAAATAHTRGAWLRPVPGSVSRPFAVGGSPFAGGQHRGVDLRAAPGTAVRAACAGRVLFAGRVPGAGRAVTVRCGRWRVTYLHLSALAVRRGRAIRRGGRIGRTGRPPGGRPHLHVGVRRDGRAFGYADPLAFFGSEGSPARPPVPPLGSRPRPVRPRLARPARARRASPVREPASLPLAPWPAWVGTALLLAGAWPAAARGRRRRATPAGLVADVVCRE